MNPVSSGWPGAQSQSGLILVSLPQHKLAPYHSHMKSIIMIVTRTIIVMPGSEWYKYIMYLLKERAFYIVSPLVFSVTAELFMTWHTEDFPLKGKSYSIYA